MASVNEVLDLVVVIAGWVGAAASVGAYAAVTRGRIRPDSLLFQGLNIGGAAALALSASINGAWPSAVVNLIWIAIGAQAVLSMKRTAILGRLLVTARRARARQRAAAAWRRQLLAGHRAGGSRTRSTPEPAAAGQTRPGGV